ncbi:MAG: GPW/gp25 family protein [Candidatus Pacebacteria bacterium]|nr:GPW/gp25 family protein [Candidatus Paceibacterota bacterium]|tara:strand:- start:285 stop:743 length:459 start_codon:yes stop_codon:yes gene_type:complete
MPITVNKGYDDAQVKNESPRSNFIYKDLNLFFTKNPLTKDVSKATDVQAIKRSVRNLVLTDRGERLFHPEIGGDVKGSLFENFTPIMEVELRSAIKNVIEIYEPRVVLEDVKVNDPSGNDLDNNRLRITIQFYLDNVPEVLEEVDVFLNRIR